VLVAVLALVITVVTLCPSQLFAQILSQRAWPLHLYQPSTRHYRVLVAPADMTHANPRASTMMNGVGQVLVNGTLWTPLGIVGAEAQLVDFLVALHTSPDTSRLDVTALNNYGQVAGSLVSSNRSALFLWTPLHAHDSVGTVTT
jgi:hypothetical protein